MSKAFRRLLCMGLSGAVLGLSANEAPAQTATRPPAPSFPAPASVPGFVHTIPASPTTSSGYGYGYATGQGSTGTTTSGKSALSPAADAVVRGGLTIANGILTGDQERQEREADDNHSHPIPFDAEPTDTDSAPDNRATTNTDRAPTPDAAAQARQLYEQFKSRVADAADQVRDHMPMFDARFLGNKLVSATMAELSEEDTAATIRQKLTDAFVEKTTVMDSQISPILSAVPERIKMVGQALTGDFMGAVQTGHEWMRRSLDKILDGKIQQAMTGTIGEPEPQGSSGTVSEPDPQESSGH